MHAHNVAVNRDERGAIVPILPEDKEMEIYALVNYISNIFWKQTGTGSFSRNKGAEYIPETGEDQKALQNKTITYTVSISSSACISGRVDFSQAALIRYLSQKDALAMLADASKMTNPTGKFRELFRILDHYFPYQGTVFDKKASYYLSRINPLWTEARLCQLRHLRNRCSHAKRQLDYITSNDLRGLKELEENIPVVKQMAEALLENPPQ